MNSPFFSVIIPTYNVAEYIRDTLSAVLAQSFTDWELIIVDDGSNDGTTDILKEYSHQSGIKIFFNDKNSGNPFLVRKRAAEQASGRYLVPFDADDIIAPDLLETAYEKISNENCQLVIPEMWRFSEDLENSFYLLPAPFIDKDSLYKGKDLVKHTLCHWEIPMAGFAIEKNIFVRAYRSLSIQDMESIHADELLSRHILLLADAVIFSDSRYYYRINPHSITNNPVKTIEGGITTNRSLLRFCKKEFGIDSEEFRKATLQNFLFLLNTLNSKKLKSLSKSERLIYKEKINNEKRNLDLTPIKNHISPLYNLLWCLPGSYSGDAIELIRSLKR